MDPLSRLPVELLEHIVGFFWHSNDAASLSACSLVSRQLLSVSRSYRFSSIQVTWGRDTNKLQDLARLLHHSPDSLPSYIRSFTFLYRILGINRPQRVADAGADLSAILSQLPNLECLKLKSVELELWDALPDVLKRSVLSVFRLPSLRSIALNGFKHIPASVFDSTTIRRMHLCRCEFAMDVDENQGVLAPTSLEELRLDTAMTNKQSLERMITFFVYPFSSVKISDLKHLSLRLRHGNENLDVMHLFSHCRHSLESLDLEADSLTNFSLEGMTKLRNIHLSIVSPVWTPPLFPDEDHENLPIPSLVAILLTIPATCVLDVIFGIFINISSQVAYRGQELRPLDEALTSLVHTGVVQRIEVLCSKGVVDPALVRPCLARCDGTGRLRISVAPETTRIFSSF